MLSLKQDKVKVAFAWPWKQIAVKKANLLLVAKHILIQ